MKRYSLVLLLLTVAVNISASPLHSKLKHTIIIDTDCSVHDLRAVSILLSHPAITVKAIIISDGQVKDNDGFTMINNLLHQLKADTIPVFFGEPQDIINKTNASGRKKTASKNYRIFPQELFQPADTQITMVCLGPLTNIARETENNPEFRKRIEEVIWYVDSVDPLKGFNYEYDKSSADQFLSSGIRFDAISGLNKLNPVFDSELMSRCKNSGTNISKALTSLSEMTLSISETGKNLTLPAEELVAFFLGNHELFELSPLRTNLNIRFNTEYIPGVLRDIMADMITGKYRSGHFVAFYGFPVNPDLYVYDVRQILEPAIARYGIEEWKACTLTDEFHGHLGVFSIVGAKMGIRARDYFGVGTDLLEIGSYAGSVEPFSCLNDGLQVSTGATLGQGRIHLINDTIARPQAVFTYNNKSVLIKLKEKYLDQLKAVIGKGIKNYGLQDEDYWNLIRQTSIKYWLEWDRNEIFEVIIM